MAISIPEDFQDTQPSADISKGVMFVSSAIAPPATTDRKSVKQVADELNCSPDTIRRYANEFSLYLSAEASPERGATRSFDQRDIELLTTARKQMSSGKNFNQVRADLSMMEFSDKVTTPSDTVTEPEVHTNPEIQGVTTAMLTLVDTVAATQAQLATIPEINNRLGMITEALQTQADLQQQVETMSQDINDLTLKNVQLVADLDSVRAQGRMYFIWFLAGSVLATGILVVVMLLLRQGII